MVCPFVTVDVRNSNNSRQQEINELGLLILVKNNLAKIFERFYE